MNTQQTTLETEWLALQTQLQKRFGKAPDLQTLLFLIGVQELGTLETDFNKEEKQDLMHIAVCHLLSLDGYFEFAGRDDDGWPHYNAIRSLPETTNNLVEQEDLLKRQIIRYFEE